MIEVQVKGTGDTVQFPDEMTDEQIKQVLQRQYSTPTLEQSVQRALTPLPSEARPYEPSMAESTGQAIANYLFDNGIISDRYGAQRVGENLSSILGLFPGVGDAQAGDEFGAAVAKGDTGGALLAGVSAIPIIGDAAKGLVKSVKATRYGDLIELRPQELLQRLKAANPDAVVEGAYRKNQGRLYTEFTDDGMIRMYKPDGTLVAEKNADDSIDLMRNEVVEQENKNLPDVRPEVEDSASSVTSGSDYRGQHVAPDPEENAPAYDVTGGGLIYPEDFYGPKGLSVYSPRTESAPKAYEILKKIRGNPEAEITIYRAVPKGVKSDNINPGDWVAITKGYADFHGQGPLQGDYKIISKKVKAKDIWTSGDSFEEWGYHPSNQ